MFRQNLIRTRLVDNLRRIGNPPGRVTENCRGRFPIGRRLSTCPTSEKSSRAAKILRFSNADDLFLSSAFCSGREPTKNAGLPHWKLLQAGETPPARQAS